MSYAPTPTCARARGVQIVGFLGQNKFEASELMRARATCGHECSSEKLAYAPFFLLQIRVPCFQIFYKSILGIDLNLSNKFNRILCVFKDDMQIVYIKLTDLQIGLFFSIYLGLVTKICLCYIINVSHSVGYTDTQILQHHKRRGLFQQFDRYKLELFRNLSGKLSSPAVQQLRTLYPGKQTANLF